MAKKKAKRKPKSGKGCMNHAAAGRRLEYRVRDWFKKQNDVIEVFRMAASKGSADLIVVAENWTSFVQVKKNRPSHRQIKDLEKLWSDSEDNAEAGTRFCEVHIVNRSSHEIWYYNGKEWRVMSESEDPDPVVKFRTRRTRE